MITTAAAQPTANEPNSAFRFRQFLPKVPSFVRAAPFEQIVYRAVLEVHDGYSVNKIQVQIVTNQQDVDSVTGEWHEVDLVYRGPHVEKRIQIFGQVCILLGSKIFDFYYRAKYEGDQDWTYPPRQPLIKGHSQMASTQLDLLAPLLKNCPDFTHIVGPIYSGNELAANNAYRLGFTHLLCVAEELKRPLFFDEPNPNQVKKQKLSIRQHDHHDNIKLRASTADKKAETKPRDSKKERHEENIIKSKKPAVEKKVKKNKNANNSRNMSDTSLKNKSTSFEKTAELSESVISASTTVSEKTKSSIANDKTENISIQKDSSLISGKGAPTKLNAESQDLNTKEITKDQPTPANAANFKDIVSHNSVATVMEETQPIPTCLVKSIDELHPWDETSEHWSGLIFHRIPWRFAVDKPPEENHVIESVSWLRKYWQPDAKILVYCKYGFMRSSCAIISFILAQNPSMTLLKAHELVYCRRPVFMPYLFGQVLYKLYPRNE